MSFQQGLSGLNSSAKNLDAIGNNVANSGTVGFKQSQVQFSDMYAASLNGGSAVQIGTGGKVSAVVQQFTQGNITNTSNTMDTAISGQGFFRMIAPSGAVSFSRNGQFQVDKDGYIVNNQGHQVSGYLPNTTGVIIPGQPVPLQLNYADLAPIMSSNVVVGANLDSRSAVPIQAVFDPLDPTSYNSSTSMTVYDSLGAAHVGSLYFVRDPLQAGTLTDWGVYLAVDGTLVDAPGTPMTTLTFDTLGTLTFPAGPPLGQAVSLPLFPLSATVDITQTLTFNFATTSQYGGNFGVNSLTQDGYSSGRLSGFSTGTDGTILGRYSNGQSRPLGQVLLANFTNPQGLQPQGNNEWVESSTSGSPLVGTPGSSALGILQSSAVEDSNVDLTAELVNMITAQRVYQANAQTIKAQDQVLQTLVNLR